MSGRLGAPMGTGLERLGVPTAPQRGRRAVRVTAVPAAPGSLRRLLRRVAVGVLGWAVVLIGLVLVPLPGPGWAIVFGGFALLGTEFPWADRLVQQVRRRLAPVLGLLSRVPRRVRGVAVVVSAGLGLAAGTLLLGH